MAENIEFIAAKDLPEATGDEVSVLCLEDGALKQKPGASLGGSGGGGYVLVVAADEMTEGENCLEITIAESYDNYAEMLYNGGSVWLDLTAPLNELYGGMTARCLVDNFVIGEDGDSNVLVMYANLVVNASSIIVAVTATGTWLPE